MRERGTAIVAAAVMDNRMTVDGGVVKALPSVDFLNFS
jgi:hypothetical protein